MGHYNSYDYDYDYHYPTYVSDVAYQYKYNVIWRQYSCMYDCIFLVHLRVCVDSVINFIVN